MVRKQLKLNVPLVASSVVEVLFAMIIILVVFTSAMMIVTNVTRASMPARRIRAMATLRDVMLDIRAVRETESRTLTVDELTIQQDVKDYPSYPGLKEVDLTAYDENHQPLAALHQIFVRQ